MAKEKMIKINAIANPTPDRTAEFNPSPKTIKFGDMVFWQNNDEQNSHQPRSVDGAKNAWIIDEIPPKGVSETLGFPAPTTPEGEPYVCNLHSGETGTIIVEKKE